MADANCSYQGTLEIDPNLDSESGGPVVAFVTPKSTKLPIWSGFKSHLEGVTNAMTYGKFKVKLRFHAVMPS